MIPVSRPYLPSRERLDHYLDKIYQSSQLTNHGPLHEELTLRLAQYLEVSPENLILVANGTLALQLAIKSLDLTGEVITSPFSFVASTSAAVWEGLRPRFCDIDAEDLNMATQKIPPLITSSTSALIPVHVFGNICETSDIQKLAKQNKLKVIYDASHCFGVRHQGKSALEYGDISTISFHATKLFHTVEGGAIYTKDTKLADKIRNMSKFGIDKHAAIVDLGINAKMSEVHAAMGLAVLDELDVIQSARATLWNRYAENVSHTILCQTKRDTDSQNHAYFPVMLKNETILLSVQRRLKASGVEARRYFYPSLETLPYLQSHLSCPNAHDIASRVLCLPLFPGLNEAEQLKIIQIVNDTLEQV